jgi:hypothetical protein
VNIKAVILIITFGICSTKCFSQRDCDSMPKNAKRYEIEQGVLTYFVYSVTRKGKKKHKLITVNITFKKYGSLQDINLNMHDLFDYEQLRMDSSFSRDSAKFLLNYFVLDRCSVYYKGISLIKPLAEKYKDKNCVRFIQYSFDDYNGNTNMGTVKYCEGIPVYIRGGDPNKFLIWELQ